MAGGRKKKVAKGKPKPKQTQNAKKEILNQEEEKTITEPYSAKNGIEKEECLTQNAKQSGPSSPSLPSKYVPPFSRTGKNSGKTEEKSLTRSPNTRKRRSEDSPCVITGAEICKENVEVNNKGECSSSNLTDVNDNNISLNLKNISKQDNVEVATHPNKQMKLSNTEETNQNSQPCATSVTEKLGRTSSDEKMITEDTIPSKTLEKTYLINMSVIEKSIEKDKSANECSSQNNETGETLKGHTSETAPITSSDKQEETSTVTTKENCSPSATSEQLSRLDDVKDCLNHLIEQIELNLQDAETAGQKDQESVQEEKQEKGFSSSNPNLTTSDLKDARMVEVANQPSENKIPRVNDTDKQNAQPDKSNPCPVNKQDSNHNQNTDTIKHQPTPNVNDMDDMEFLMDCTDSQLICDEVLAQSYTCTADENYRSEAESKIKVPGKTVMDKTRDHELEDGTFIVEEIIKEITSIKSYLTMARNKHEQIHKRNGPCIMLQ